MTTALPKLGDPQFGFLVEEINLKYGYAAESRVTRSEVIAVWACSVDDPRRDAGDIGWMAGIPGSVAWVILEELRRNGMTVSVTVQ